MNILDAVIQQQQQEVLYETCLKKHPAYVSAAVVVHSEPQANHQTLPLGQALDE